MRRVLSSLFDGDRLAWPLLLLLLMVLISSVGVVWMMREAVRNERLAAEQRLREAYRVQLESAAKIVLERWRTQLERLAAKSRELSPAEAFAGAVTDQLVDSLLVLDFDGRPLYPNAASPTPSTPNFSGPEWQRAEQLEFTTRSYRDAADAYAQIVGDESSSALHAYARRAQIRCLLRSDEREPALALLRVQSSDTASHDEQGRSFAAAANLRLVELLGPQSEEGARIADELRRRLGRYNGPAMPSSQRRFLMAAIQELTPTKIDWPTQSAEELAAQALAAYDESFAAPRLQYAATLGVWTCASADRRIVTLYRTATLGEALMKLTEGLPLPSGVAFATTAPQAPSDFLQEISLGSAGGGWRLGLTASEHDPLTATWRGGKAVHAWIAGLIVAVTCVLAWLLANALRRQIQLAQLKNDLVATVSHELKTPLAAIRLLVDTLLADSAQNSDHKPNIEAREYLELIAQENARLTRLIENFLTFSRLERGKQRYEFQDIAVRDVVDQAATVVRDRWEDAPRFLRVDCSRLGAGRTAVVRGDVDALVTALVNLLENAWKFTGENRQINLVAHATEDQVTLAVSDNGIGLNRRSARRVFERFYQVDQRVARTQSGCGLGLSIVQAIIRSHGGEVRAESQLGKGSTFTLLLPRCDAAASEEDSR